MGYRVKTVSAMTGIPRGTLLAWERRYDILDPDRSASGYREYTDADVALFRRLKSLVDAGYSISEAAALVRERPEGGAPRLDAGRSREPSAPAAATLVPPAPAAGRWGDLPDQILQALLAFDRAAADRLVPRLGQVSFQSAMDDLYVPILHRLGDLWEGGGVSIAQEHFVSGFCREQLLAMYHGLGGGPATGMPVACATPPGERHELGLLVLALKLALAGHRVIWLGADLPVPDLCAYLATNHPRFLCLSFTRPASDDAVDAFARSLRAGAPPGTDIVLGGPGLSAFAGALPEGVQVVTSFSTLEAMFARAAREGRGLGDGERARR